MDGNHRFTPDSKEFNTVVKSKESSTGRNPYQTPPLEHNGTHHQTNYSRKENKSSNYHIEFLVRDQSASFKWQNQ
ncbi:ASB_collapsed_G0024770.mRNA.1.CDS.1 [Saccharomyces cerevisiae]|nr:ASB_collapsed_G0024770.mRNA.1.CDS.1 [Saccharomyces cerevisiae]